MYRRPRGAKAEQDSNQVVPRPGLSCLPPMIMTNPSVDMQKQMICFAVSFSRNRNGDTMVTITGAK